MPRILSFGWVVTAVGLLLGAIVGAVSYGAFGYDLLTSAIVACVIWFFLVVDALSQSGLSILYLPAGSLVELPGCPSEVIDHLTLRSHRGEFPGSLTKAEPQTVRFYCRCRAYKFQVSFSARLPGEIRDFRAMGSRAGVQRWLGQRVAEWRQGMEPHLAVKPCRHADRAAMADSLARALENAFIDGARCYHLGVRVRPTKA